MILLMWSLKNNNEKWLNQNKNKFIDTGNRLLITSQRGGGFGNEQMVEECQLYDDDW